MSPIQAIAMLDRALERNGEDATLARYTLGPNGVQIPVSVKIRAMLRGYQPHEMAAGSGVIEGDSRVILSPTQIDAAHWPGSVPTNPHGDIRVPTKGDRIVIAGRTTTVQACAVVRIGDALVRLEAHVRG